MDITIHRGSHQIGGSCVELKQDNCTILIDIGLPLDHELNESLISALPQPLFNEIECGSKIIHAVILSHAHMDHYGLAGLFPEGTPIYCGAASSKLMEITTKIIPGKLFPFNPSTFNKPFQIGPFFISPVLMDHSAFDSYGFLISTKDKTVFYTGDFRGHGRKSKIFDRLIKSPPKVNVLLTEGTMLGNPSDRVYLSEDELEHEFVRVIKETLGIVLVTTSSQNIDRLVTIYRASKRCGRKLIIDFYTAEVLEIASAFAKIPTANTGDIDVCYPYFLAERFKELGLESILLKHRNNGLRWSKINEMEKNAVMLLRPAFLFDLKRRLDLQNATWIYSMWRGYLDSNSAIKLRNYLEEKGVRFEYLHTSGHAKIEDLKKLAEAISPSIVVPMHTNSPDLFKDIFSNVRILNDGEKLTL